jgi:peptidoglycan/LPS O-acetylase OafA/YrhL
MIRLAVVAIWLVLAPSAALACPGCVSSPYGDRTFGWAYLILYAAPFFVASGIAGALAYSRRSRRAPAVRAWRGLWPLGRQPHRAPEEPGRGTPALLQPHGLDKETT